MGTSWVTIATGLISALGSCSAVVVAWRQLSNMVRSMQEQVKADKVAAESMKHQLLTNVLAIESEMNARKAEVDRLNLETEVHLNDPQLEAYNRAREAAVENWCNAVETLCFCINKAYINERDWRVQYRGYVATLVETYPKKFEEATSGYTNIIDLNKKWKRE